ncbi:MAG: DUF1428 domain-containing protein [Pacificimonas sp.]|jgi:uncharacterized protein YbaA (DUF1428 family)|nr:DUF1428 domain-containing protein [Pacificimonas sp.]
MTYFDSFVLPLSPERKDAYIAMAEKFRDFLRTAGALDYFEAIAEDVPHGETTDFYRAVNAEKGETVVISYTRWPDKKTRDAAWAAMMEDPQFKDMKPEDMPFDGRRMFWGGFDPIISLND